MPHTGVKRAALAAGLILVSVSAGVSQVAGELVDMDAVAAIRAEGLENSHMQQLAHHLTDVIGPRLTGSPMLMEASEWILSRLEEWGMENGRLEAWGPFGRGWTLESFSMHARGTVNFPVHAYPKAWSPDLGPTTAEVVIFDAAHDHVPIVDAVNALLQGAKAREIANGLLARPLKAEGPVA